LVKEKEELEMKLTAILLEQPKKSEERQQVQIWKTKEMSKA
jgi:hypothetical protein